jgi:predicted Zn finger-like uncharacterized protein
MAIPLTCPSCGHEFKVKDELAGKRIRCPKCKEVMKVQIAEEETEPEEEEVERPKKKKKKGKKDNRLLIGSAIGGGVLIVAAVLVFIFTRGSQADQNKVVQKKANIPAAKPVVKAEEPDEEPKPKKGPASSAGRVRDRIELENAMRQIGIAYTQFETERGKGPNGIEDLGIQANAITNLLKDKTITFIWGANSKNFPEGKSNTIIAYETDADSIGNRVILKGDGSVTTVDEATFQKTPKALGK